MRSRKELKKSGLKSLKKHYLIFILLCVIASFIGSEFNNSLSITKIENSFLNNDNNIVEKVNNDAVKKIKKDTNIDIDNKINEVKSKRNKIKKKYTNKIFENKRGVFASIVNIIDEGSLYLTIFFAIKSIVGVASISSIISVILSFIIYFSFWLFFVNVFKIISRRIFLEGRIYKKIAIKDSLFLIRVKKWLNSTKVMFKVFIYQFLWDLTIIGGIIKRYSYYMVPYIMAENPGIKSGDAIKLSRDMMNGHKFECFVLELSFIGWEILGILTFGLLDIFFTNSYQITTFSEYYYDLRKISKDKKIKNIDLLSDKYLYEVANSKLLSDTYYKDLENIDVKVNKPESIKDKVEDFFGINLSSSEREYEYEKNKVNEIKLKNIEAEVNGLAYPSKLYIIPEKKKRKRFEIVNYLRRYNITSIILMFFIFSFVGWFWEVILHLLESGNFVNRGVMYGPWLPIYGTGGVIVLILLNKLRDKPLIEFLSIIFVCGIIEYFTSYFLEITHNGVRWWDYSGYFININGRICAEGLLVFGLGGIVVVYFVAPFLDNIIKKLNKNVVVIVSIILITIFMADKIYSSKHPNIGEGITSYNIVNKLLIGMF